MDENLFIDENDRKKRYLPHKVKVLRSICFAKPKSVILMLPFTSRRRFSGCHKFIKQKDYSYHHNGNRVFVL
jgi:hypothetical protein